MSDQEKTQNNERKPFEITVDEPYKFEAIADSKFYTIPELCEKVSKFFKQVFVDYVGCMFNVSNVQGGIAEPTISLVFDHDEHDIPEGMTRACERPGSKLVGSTVIDRGRQRDMLSRNGDRFYLTEDGKDVVKTILSSKIYNGGNLDFKRIVSEIQDRNTSFTGPRVIDYTTVNYIGIDRLFNLMFTKPEDKGKISYLVTYANYKNAFGVIEYLINVVKISSTELEKFCGKIGYNFQSLNIYR